MHTCIVFYFFGSSNLWSLLTCRDKKRETVVLGAFAFLGLTLCAGESLFGGVKKEKSQEVEPLI